MMNTIALLLCCAFGLCNFNNVVRLKIKFLAVILYGYMCISGLLIPVKSYQILNLQDKINRITLDRRRELKEEENLPGRIANLVADKNNGLSFVDNGVSIEKTKIIRLQESYRGVPIYNAYVTEEVDSNTGLWTGQVSGNWYEELEKDIPSVVPTLSKNQALSIAITSEGIPDLSEVKDSDITLIIVPLNGTAVLSYDVTLLVISRKTMKRPGMFIDANSGRVLRKIQKLRQSTAVNAVGGNKKIDQINYGVDFPRLEVASNDKGTVCMLESKLVRVFDLHSQTYPNSADPFKFPCKQGIRDEINGGYSPLSDAFYMTQKVYEMFTQWAHTEVIPNPPIDIWVHYGEMSFQASYNGRALVFGDGNKANFPLVTYDVVGHEFAHVFTEVHSDLEYENKSGGINEAFSDLAGEALELFVTGTNDLHIAAKTDKKDEEGLRDMCNQDKDGGSIVHVRDYREGMEVHYSSGIFNKVSCILIKEKNFGVKNTFQIFAHANRFYWGPKSDFVDAACGTLKAAYDLGHDTIAIREAFSTVGITGCKLDNYVRKLLGETHLTNLTAEENESIVYGFNGKTFLGRFIRIFTEGGIGDVDIYVNKGFKLDKSSAKYSSTNEGNLEAVQIPIKKCVKKMCFVHLVPKVQSFSGVSFQMNIIY